MKKRIISLALSTVILIYFELVVRIFTIGFLDARFIYTALFALPVGGVLFLFTLSDKRVFKIIYNILISVTAIFFIVQLVYYKVFQGFMSLSLVGMGGDAMTNFTSELLAAVKAALPGILLVLIVAAGYIILTVKNIIVFKKTTVKTSLITVAGIVVVHIICLLLLRVGGTGVYTVYDAYHSSSTGIDSSVQNLGVFVTARLELKNMLLNKLGISTDDVTEIVMSDNITTDQSTDEYNILDINFDEIKKTAEGNAAVESIFDTLEWRGGTKKNEYTGVFEGYNLITICAYANAI